MKGKILNNLVEDIKLFSNEGYISRRNYIVNFLTIGIISSLFLMFVFPKFQTENMLLDLVSAGIIYLILYIISSLIFSILTAFNMSKRLSDIKNIEPKNSIFCVILTFLLLCQFLPLFNYSVGVILSLFVIFAQLFFMVKKGKITSTLAKSELYKFNWGAFFGTFIWGLFNKTYIALLIIPLFLTPSWLFFGIILGIKGNEWAYKNKAYDSIEKFHKSQKKQAIFWSIVTPVLSIVLTVVLSVVLSLAIASDEQKAKIENRPSYMETLMTNELKKIYDDYELKENEYKFYVNESFWNKLSNYEKKAAFKSATLYAEYKNIYSKTPETKDIIMKKTKIYSSDNKLLFEMQ